MALCRKFLGSQDTSKAKPQQSKLTFNQPKNGALKVDQTPNEDTNVIGETTAESTGAESQKSSEGLHPEQDESGVPTSTEIKAEESMAIDAKSPISELNGIGSSFLLSCKR